jgi:aryl-alcohol dehydrogenase-like predicted oxidoreductase
MKYRRLGVSDLQVSMVALGCGSFGGLGAMPRTIGLGENQQEARALLDAAHERGINLLDTANTYGGGRSEEWIGRWLRERPSVRDNLVITTKVGTPVGPGEADRGLSAGHVRAQLEASLRRLGTDRIDLYLTHEPDPRTPFEETLAVFDELIRAGKIRHYGLANFDGEEIAKAVAAAEAHGRPKPVNAQIGHNLLEPAPAGIVDTCAVRGIGVTAFSALSGGWLAEIYRPGGPYPDRSRMTVMPERYRSVERLVAGGALAALRAEADRRGIALSTLAISWLLSDPTVSAAIIGPSTPDQLTPAIAALDHLLDPAERAAVTAIVDAVRDTIDQDAT